MSNALVTQEPRSVLNAMSERFGMEPQAFEATVRATCMKPQGGKEATREEFAALLLVAKAYDLNPLTKEIYAFPAKGGGIVPVVSIDGWVNLIQSHPACDGFEFEDEHDEKGNLISCTCTMYRKDRSRPVRITEYLIECLRSTEPWKMKHRMLRHKTLIQAARYAFGFAGVYDIDEAEKIADIRDITPKSSPPAPPAQDKIAADKPMRFWHHPESSSVWESVENEEGQGDGMTVEVDEATFLKLQEEYASAKSSEATTSEDKPAPAAKASPPAPPKTTAKREQTIDADPFDGDAAKFDRDMAKAGSMDELKVMWKQRPESASEEQLQRLKDIRDKHKKRVEKPAEGDEQSGDASATDEQTDGAGNDPQPFDPAAFKDDILKRLADCEKQEEIDDLLMEVDTVVEEGLLSDADKEKHFDDAFAEKMSAIG